MSFGAIGPISVFLPEKVETNDDLQNEFPSWNLDLIYSKTGIRARHIAAPDECASDLGVQAAEKLFREHQIDRESIDFLLFCTQTPDYPLPTTACLMQDRLDLRTSCGALDFNLGCSGYVYGLSLADDFVGAQNHRSVRIGQVNYDQSNEAVGDIGPVAVNDEIPDLVRERQGSPAVGGVGDGDVEEGEGVPVS